ncbi:alanine--tRNA ligase-related protein [Desulfobacterales bacterium HSG2]|nr:alanine--tRNA ligase-related protein [Desulfobacterales bacterium HSG2]
MECAEIRQQFVKYYEDHGFRFLPRTPILQSSSPMSFVFSCYPPDPESSPTKEKGRSGNKFVMVQDCFRHFDLDSVGADNIHLSLFEMSGAFVFGKNGRQDTISRMWNLATEVMGMNSKHIWVSYFGGGRLADRELSEDGLTHQTWQDIGVPEERLVGLGVQHNYWVESSENRSGETLSLKCGPNTELFYDMGVDKACGPDCQPGCRCGRFVEFSNSRFVSHTLLPKTDEFSPSTEPHTETVIGTERIAMILQEVQSVFDIESYRPLMEIIHQFVKNTDLPIHKIEECGRVIADHLKSLCILVAEGAPPPGRSGRSRLVRVLIRKVIARQMVLGIASQHFLTIFIAKLIKTLDNDVKPGLEAEDKIRAYFDLEFLRFQKTVGRGRCKIERILTKNRGQTLSGSQIAYLEKEWGMPHLLSATILHKKGLAFAETEYKEVLKRWKTHGRFGGENGIQ